MAARYSSSREIKKQRRKYRRTTSTRPQFAKFSNYNMKEEKFSYQNQETCLTFYGLKWARNEPEGGSFLYLWLEIIEHQWENYPKILVFVSKILSPGGTTFGNSYKFEQNWQLCSCAISQAETNCGYIFRNWRKKIWKDVHNQRKRERKSAWMISAIKERSPFKAKKHFFWYQIDKNNFRFCKKNWASCKASFSTLTNILIYQMIT